MAYVVSREDEEQRQGLAPNQGDGGIAGGSGGMSVKGTGGIAPFVNIQSYLQANPNDQSQSKILENSFTKPFQEEKAKSVDALTAQKNQLDSTFQPALDTVAGSRTRLPSLNENFRHSVLGPQFKTPTLVGNQAEFANELATQFKAPELKYTPFSNELTTKAASLSDPYAYIKNEYAKQGMTQGQRALQDQLGRQDTAFPQIAKAIKGQFEQAVKDQNQLADYVAGGEEKQSQFDAEKRISQAVYDDYLNRSGNAANLINNNNSFNSAAQKYGGGTSWLKDMAPYGSDFSGVMKTLNGLLNQKWLPGDSRQKYYADNFNVGSKAALDILNRYGF